MRRGADGGLSAGRSFPRHDIPDGIALERHRLRLEAARVAAHASLRIGNAGSPQKPHRDGVSPHLGLAGLVLELRQHFPIPLVVNAALEWLPRVHVSPAASAPS